MANDNASASIDPARITDLVGQALTTTCGKDELPGCDQSKTTNFGAELARLWAREGFKGDLSTEINESSLDAAQWVKGDDSPAQRAEALRAPTKFQREVRITGTEDGRHVLVAKLELAAIRSTEEVGGGKGDDYLWSFGWLLGERDSCKRLFVGSGEKEHLEKLMKTLERRYQEHEESAPRCVTAVVLLPTGETEKEEVRLGVFEEGKRPQFWQPWRQAATPGA